ncbi:unnamed protein product, partial [Ectocarpus sp. 8 AP-2014]
MQLVSYRHQARPPSGSLNVPCGDISWTYGGGVQLYNISIDGGRAPSDILKYLSANMDVHVHAHAVDSCNFCAWEQSADLPHGYFLFCRLNIVARDREYTASAYRRHVFHVVAAAWHNTMLSFSGSPLFSVRFFQPYRAAL